MKPVAGYKEDDDDDDDDDEDNDRIRRDWITQDLIFRYITIFYFQHNGFKKYR